MKARSEQLMLVVLTKIFDWLAWVVDTYRKFLCMDRAKLDKLSNRTEHTCLSMPINQRDRWLKAARITRVGVPSCVGLKVGPTGLANAPSHRTEHGHLRSSTVVSKIIPSFVYYSFYYYNEAVSIFHQILVVKISLNGFLRNFS